MIVFTSLMLQLYNIFLFFNSEHNKISDFSFLSSILILTFIFCFCIMQVFIDFYEQQKSLVNVTLQSFYLLAPLVGLEPTTYRLLHHTNFHQHYIQNIICSLDFLFTMSYDLGRWCKVSTHSFRLARYCLQHYLLRVSPTQPPFHL